MSSTEIEPPSPGGLRMIGLPRMIGASNVSRQAGMNAEQSTL